MGCLMVFAFLLSETTTRVETSTAGNNNLSLSFKGFDAATCPKALSATVNQLLVPVALELL